MSSLGCFFLSCNMASGVRRTMTIVKYYKKYLDSRESIVIIFICTLDLPKV